MKKKSLPERIDDALNGRPMKYYDLAKALYPGPRSWQYQSNGGPPGCFMSLTAGLKRGGFYVTLERTTHCTVYPRSESQSKIEARKIKEVANGTVA